VLDPTELYVLDDHHVELASGDASSGEARRPVLVHALTGFIDAGSAGQLVRDHLLQTLEHRVIATFDVDQLLDYRSRRPAMIFVEDHWESYDDPFLRLHLVHDPAGQPFLLLAGCEPDIQWERFIAAVRTLIEQLDVRLTIGVHGIPMGVPHTRATGVTGHGTRRELVAGMQPWIGTVQVPGSVINLLEFRLGQAGHDAMGFAAHVPHYLAQADYPAAAAALVDAVNSASGLSIPTEDLRAAGERTRLEIDAQVGGSDEVAAVVRALEEQYDAFLEARGRDRLGSDRPFPTADELGAEFERYLAERSKDGDAREN
jgi:predicted ATP-grasp superfamily ATP-dependent carboligase